MRRSRRSLSLLLGMMAVSLSVVRATTQPALDAGRNLTIATTGAALAGASLLHRSSTRRVLEVRDPSALPARSSSAQRPGNDSQTDQNATPRSARPVSAIAVILVIPGPSKPAVPRIGWSGCKAYAVGCDHLGRPFADGKDEEIVGALSARRF